MAESNAEYLKYGDAQSLQDFQYNGIDYLYNLEPQQNNLFMLDKFYDPYLSGNSTDGYDMPSSGKPSKIEYRLKKVSGFKLPSLKIEDKYMSTPFRWNYVATGRSEANTVKIDWVEDAFWTVKRYHMNWMNHWYNRYLDCMVVGQRGKFRNLVLYMYHYVNLNTTTATPIQKAVPIARFEFKGLVPKNLGDGNFEWGSPENEAPTSIDYTYNYLEIYFYPYTKSEKEFIGGLADFVQMADDYENTPVAKTWNTGIVGYSDAETLIGLNPDGQFKDCKDGLHQAVYYI